MVRTRSIGKGSPNNQESSFKPSTKGRKRQITQTEDPSVLTSSAALSPLPGPSGSQPSYSRYSSLTQDDIHLSPGRRSSASERDQPEQSSSSSSQLNSNFTDHQDRYLAPGHSNLAHANHQPGGLVVTQASATHPSICLSQTFAVSDYLTSNQQLNHPTTTTTTSSTTSWLIPVESGSANQDARDADLLQPVGGGAHGQGLSGQLVQHHGLQTLHGGDRAHAPGVGGARGGPAVHLPPPSGLNTHGGVHAGHHHAGPQPLLNQPAGGPHHQGEPLVGSAPQRDVSPPLQQQRDVSPPLQQQRDVSPPLQQVSTQQQQHGGGSRHEDNASDLVIFTTRESGVQADVDAQVDRQADRDTPMSQGFLPDDIKHSLECPVCARIALPPVMQCRNGHVTCNACRMKVQSCPMCREIDIDIRNLFAEKAITYMNIPCEYKSFGCRIEIHFKDKENHERGCHFRPYICPYIECDHKLAADAVVLHVSTAHREECRRSDGPEITASMILIGMYFGGDGAWSPRVITCFGRTFFDVALTRDRWLHHWVWLLGEEEEATQFLYEITAFKGNTKYVYGSEVSSLRTSDDEIVSEGKCLSISDAIGRRLRDGDKIRYKLKLVRK